MGYFIFIARLINVFQVSLFLTVIFMVYLNKSKNRIAKELLYTLLLVVFLYVLNSCINQKAAVQIDGFEEKGDSYHSVFKYDSAIIYYNKALYNKSDSEDILQMFRCSRKLSRSFLDMAWFDSAYTHSFSALLMADTALSLDCTDEKKELAELLLIYGDVLEEIGSMEARYEAYDSARILFIDNDIDSYELGARIYDKLGVASRRLGEYERAQNFHLTAIRIRGQMSVNDTAINAESYHGIASIFLETAKYPNAILIFNSLLNNLKNNHDNLLLISRSYQGLAIAYRELGSHEKSFNALDSALVNFKRIFGENHQSVSSCLMDKAINFGISGKYLQAHEMCIEATRVKQKVYGVDHPEMASNYSNLGIGYYNQGENYKALEYFSKAARLQQNLSGYHKTSLAKTYNNISSIYLVLEQYDKACSYLKKSLEINQGIYGYFNTECARNYRNLAGIYIKMERYDSARVFNKHALLIRAKILGESHPKIADYYWIEGEIYKNLANLDSAVRSFKKAIHIKMDAYHHHPEIIHLYNQIADTYFEHGFYTTAISYLDSAMMNNVSNSYVMCNPGDELQNILDVGEYLSSLYIMGACHYRLNNYMHNNPEHLVQSLYSLNQALGILSSYRESLSREYTKYMINGLERNIQSLAIQVNSELSYNSPNSNIDLAIYKLIEQSKGINFSVEMYQQIVYSKSEDQDSVIALANHVRNRIETVSLAIEKLNLNANLPQEKEIQAHMDELFYLNQKYDSLQRELKTRYPQLYTVKKNTRYVEKELIQKQLDENTAILDFFVNDSALYIYCITKDSSNIHFSRIDTTFYQLVNDFYRSLKKADVFAFNIKSQQLFIQLIKPVLSHIDKKDRLIIMPDGPLYYVPFESLTISNGNNNEVEYLIERFTISYHYSTSLWYHQQKRDEIADETWERSLLGFAPVFKVNSDNLKMLASTRSIITHSVNSEFPESLRSGSLIFTELPHSEEELNYIADIFKDTDKTADVYLFSDATEENFKLNCSMYKYLHIASHGLANNMFPKLSCIVFSQPVDDSTIDRFDSMNMDYSDHGEDGFLYTAEVNNLNINADLVVLSSCEGGIGKMVTGEGMLSLTRSFIYSGAHNIIYSLFKVPDEPTKDLMISYYTYMLRGDNYAESLRKAKLGMIQSNDHNNPFFWSGFVLLGK